MERLPTPKPLTPTQCLELEKVGLWEDLLTNLFFLFPIILAYLRNQTFIATMLAIVMIVSILHHNYDSKKLAAVDTIVATIAAVIMISFAWNYKTLDAYKIGFLSLSTLGFVIFLAGELKNRDRKVIHIATHNLFHVLSSLAAFILLLSPVFAVNRGR